MRSRSVSLLLVAAMLACSSGLVLAVHLHEAGERHDAHHCSLCLDLIHPSAAMLPAGQPDAIVATLVERVAVEPASLPVARYVSGGLGSRAPPLLSA